MNNAKHIKHLYARAGFGIRFEDLHDHENWSVKKAVRKLFKASEKNDQIGVLTENIERRNYNQLTEAEKKLVQEERNKQTRALNCAWVQQLSETDGQLREKMTLFWHNHFACNIG